MPINKKYARRPMKARKSGGVVKRAVRNYKKKSLIKLIKRVSLKQSETKHTHNIQENIQLYHNVPNITATNLFTSISNSDNNAGVQNFACRLGDEVIARGLSYKFWFANKLDRPNVMYKIVFFRYQSGSGTLPAEAPFYIQGTSNYMIRDLDTEKYKIIKTVNFNLQTSAQRITSADVFNGAEGHKKISVWIPLKSMKLKYENNSVTPKFTEIGYTIVAYDSFGTLQTDNIASYAVNRKFYFKDP